MKKYLLLLPAIAFFASCTKQDLENATDQQQNQIVLTAESPSPIQGEAGDGATLRTYINPSTSPMQVYWSGGDAFGVRAINNVGLPNADFTGNKGTYVMFTYQGSGNGTETTADNVSVGKFTCDSKTLPKGSYIAFYPYNSTMLIGQNNLSIGNGHQLMRLSSQIQSGNGTYNPNVKTDAYMYSDIIDNNDQKAINIDAVSADFVKSGSPAVYFHNAMAFFVLNLQFPLDAGISKVYQIKITSTDPVNWPLLRTCAINPHGAPYYGDKTPSIVLHADNGSGADECSVGAGGYQCGIIVTPICFPGTSTLVPGCSVWIDIMTDQGWYSFKSNFPNGVQRSYFYKISPPASILTKHASNWDGKSYSMPYIDNINHNIIIRTASELRWLSGVCNDFSYVPSYDFGGVAGPTNDPAFFNFDKNGQIPAYTITLADNIDLNGQTWRAIGLRPSYGFAGIFNGNGKIISNFVLEGANTENGGYVSTDIFMNFAGSGSATNYTTIAKDGTTKTH